MKHHTCTRLLSLVLAVVMALSLLSVAAFAAEVPAYAHLEIGTASGQPGETVKIPVYMKGIKDGQKCRGFDTTVVLGENLTLEGAEWTDLVSGFDYKICNKSSGYLTANDVMGSGFRITENGKLCDLLVKIADDATSVGTVSLTKVSISGDTAVDFLNSTDGKMSGRDQNAVVPPTDENGSAVPVISIKPTASFIMKVEADKTSVTAGEDVTVTIKVEGGDFVGAAAKLAYDSSKFAIKTPDTSTGWSETSSDGYAYYNVAAGQSATLGTFVFTALAQADEVTGSFTLSDTYCEETWDSGASPDDATPCANNGKVDVTIALKTNLDVTSENKTVTYDGNEQAFNNVTCSVEDAVIAYGETEGTYDLTTVPSKTDVGTYTLYYKVTALGYAPKTGSYTLTINPASIEYTATGFDGTYDGANHTITVTVTKPANAVITYSDEENGTYKDTAPVYSQANTNATVWFKITAGSNYVDVKDSRTVKINEADMTVDITANERVTYDGQPHVSATINELIPNGASISYMSDETQVGTAGNNTPPSFTDAGTYVINWTAMRNGYKVTTGSYTFYIDKANIDANSYSIAANDDVNYDGAAHASATATIPEGMTVTYTCDGQTYNEIPSFTEIGTYTVSYTVSAGNNYENVTDRYTFKIKEGTLTDITGMGYNAPYDGQDHTITVTAPEGAAVTYSETESGEYSATAPTLTDAGTKTVYWKVEKTGYTTVTGSNTITITQKDVTITIDAQSKSIGDADPEFTATVTGLVNNNDLGTITYTRESGETEGTYEISASYTQNANYNVTVTKANLTITPPTFVVETVVDYVPGYSLVLVYTDSNATFTYDNAAMYDVTSAGYKYESETTIYAHVYALVVEGEADQTKIAAGTTPVAGTLDCSDLDVNKSGSVDLRDAVAVVAVYNANETYMTNYMSIVLEADVNHDKHVNATDFGAIKAEYLK